MYELPVWVNGHLWRCSGDGCKPAPPFSFSNGIVEALPNSLIRRIIRMGSIRNVTKADHLPAIREEHPPPRIDLLLNHKGDGGVIVAYPCVCCSIRVGRE